MEYNLGLQNVASKSTQLKLERVQNNALRFISGGLRSTPTAACEIHTNVEPLGLRRKAAALEMHERYKRFEIQHPNRQLVDNWKPNKRIKKKSILQVAEEENQTHQLPQRREEIMAASKIPPNLQLKSPIITTQLISPTPNKSEDPDQLKQIAENTIETYSNWIHIYTDGSAMKGTINAGYGFRIEYPDGSLDELFNPCGAHCSNHEAEIIAIEASLHHLSSVFTLFPQKIQNTVVLSDSKTTLETLSSNILTSSSICSLATEINDFMTENGIQLYLQWIPSHIDIPGNEKADLLAKKGANLPQPTIPSSLKTAKQMIKDNLKHDWINQWALGSTGRCMFPYMPTPSRKDYINLLNRKQQSIIFQLRTQHTILNEHLSKIKSNINPTCPLCNRADETTRHHLFICPKLTDIRKQLLPPNPTIENTLYSNKQQLINTTRFFTMAMDRRARAQVVAGSAK